MSFTRREFLLGSAAGLVLPSFFDRAFAYFENHGEPLLEASRHTAPIMYACSELDGGRGFQMAIGDPWTEPPYMTVREFCRRYHMMNPEPWWMEKYVRNRGMQLNVDEQANTNMVLEQWAISEAPHVLGHEYLKAIDLGPRLKGAEAVGELKTVVGVMGGDYIATHAADGVTLSLLQNRLNELNSGIRIVVC